MIRVKMFTYYIHRVLAIAGSVLAIYYAFFAQEKNYLFAGAMLVVSFFFTVISTRRERKMPSLFQCLRKKKEPIPFLLEFGFGISTAMLTLTLSHYIQESVLLPTLPLVLLGAVFIVLSSFHLIYCSKEQ